MKNNRSPLLCYFKMCASFCGHRWIKPGATVRKRSIRVKVGFVYPVRPWNLTIDLEKTAPLLCHFQLFVSFRNHLWIHSGVTVRNWPNWGNICLTSVTLTFDLWPLLFAWASLPPLVITAENFLMIRWEEHCENGRCDIRRDRRTDGRTNGRREPFLKLLGRS